MSNKTTATGGDDNIGDSVGDREVPAAEDERVNGNEISEFDVSAHDAGREPLAIDPDAAREAAAEIMSAASLVLPASEMPDADEVERAVTTAATGMGAGNDAGIDAGIGAVNDAGCDGLNARHAARSGWMLFCPHRMVDSVEEVDAAELKAQCIRGVILDLDNTLVLWHQEEMTESIQTWLANLRSEGLEMCILSNSVLSKRSQRIGERLGCHYVKQAGKPGRTGFRKAMELMGTTAASTAIVGDQMFTDILGGNRSGIYTVMVRPLHKHEFPYTRYVSRPPEKLLLKWFKRRGSI